MKRGERFRTAREAAGLSQGQVAEYVDTSQGYISDIELDKRWPTTWTLLTNLVARYRVSADFLLGLADTPSGHMQSAALPLHGEEMLGVLRELPESRQDELVEIGRLMVERARNEAAMHQMLDLVQAVGGDEALGALLEVLELAKTDEAAASERMEAFFRGRVQRQPAKRTSQREREQGV